MDCHDAKERLREERYTAAVHRHLERCPDCTSFQAELQSGGREIGEAFLSRSPSPGFEERIARRLAEREIAVTPGRRLRLASLLSPALLALLLVAGYFLVERGGQAVPSVPEDPRDLGETAVVVTHPERENILVLSLDAAGTAGPTRVEMVFAGIRDTKYLAEDLEDAVFRLWVRGARRARMVVGKRVPGRDMLAVQAILERAGFAYSLIREKDPRAP